MTFSGFDLPDELEDMRALVKSFVTDRIIPIERELQPADGLFPDDVLTRLRAEARASGIWCLDAPEEVGGAGLDCFSLVVVLEEATKHRLSFPLAGGGAFGQSPPVVLYDRSEHLTEHYVRPAIEHGWGTFTAIGESSGGSDPARAIRTRAKRDGSDYVLNGRKMWITNFDKARYGVVYARTEAGITAFVVDTDTPGITAHKIPVIRDRWPAELVLDDVRVPAENMIGNEGQGLELASQWLVRSRLVLAARALGVAQEALRMAIAWMQDRETFGAPLATRQGLQWQVVDLQYRIESTRLLMWRAAWDDDHGRDARPDAAAAKLYSTELAFEAVDRAMQIMGAMGMARETPLEKWLRDLRVARVVEGTTEVLRNQLARVLIGPSVRATRDSPPSQLSPNQS